MRHFRFGRLRRALGAACLAVAAPLCPQAGETGPLPGYLEIPGVLLPELEEDLPSAASPAPSRPAEQGMTMRQLDPLFMLARGSEGAALDANRRGDSAVYRDQLSKAVAAYMEIVNMADAGNEAREEAWYGVARCEYRLGNWWRCFEAVERSFPRKYLAAEVAGRLRLEMFVGERAWQLGEAPVPDAAGDGSPLSGYRAAERVYAAVVFNDPRGEGAPLALLRQGDSAFMDERWDDAEKFYRQIIANYGDGDFAMRARASLAETLYRKEWPAGFPDAARDDIRFLLADVERTGDGLSPDAGRRYERALEAGRGMDVRARMRQARDYLSVRTRQSRQAAIFLLTEIVEKYPGAPEAAEAGDILSGLSGSRSESPAPAGSGPEAPADAASSEQAL